MGVNKATVSLLLVAALSLGACAMDSPSEAVPAPAPAPATEVVPEASAGNLVDACASWAPETRDWFELTPVDGDTPDAVVARFVLPSSTAPRYNTLLEVCPGLWWVLTFSGESRFIDLGEQVWSVGPALAPSGEVDSISAPGVESGGPIWGFRDSVLGGATLYLSDGVLDSVLDCVRVDVHTLLVDDLLGSESRNPLPTTIAYRSSPCVSYADSWRSDSPIRTHLGGALAFSPADNSVFLSIGDFHLGASSLRQAAAIGIANTEKDYALLSDPTSALGALVRIPLDGGKPQIVAKGLRNSLGLTHSLDDTLWISDHGPSGGDELNRYSQGANYGWPFTTQGEPYDRSSWPEDAGQLPAEWLDIGNRVIPGVTDPTLWWTPAIAPTAVVDISAPSSAVTQLALGGLRSEAVVTVTVEGDSATETGRVNVGARVRDMALNSRGSLLVLITDSGELISINPEALR